MGAGCCIRYGGPQDRCWEYGDAPSGGDRTTAGRVTSKFFTNQMTIQRGPARCSFASRLLHSHRLADGEERGNSGQVLGLRPVGGEGGGLFHGAGARVHLAVFTF